jgi:hypothetical protein
MYSESIEYVYFIAFRCYEGITAGYETMAFTDTCKQNSRQKKT